MIKTSTERMFSGTEENERARIAAGWDEICVCVRERERERVCVCVCAVAQAHLFWHSCCEEHCSHAYLLAPCSVSVDEKPRRHADNEVFCSTSIDSSRKSCAQSPQTAHQHTRDPNPSASRKRTINKNITSKRTRTSTSIARAIRALCSN